MDMPETVSFYRRKLPHWRVCNRTYFVTFRLYGTIPKHVIQSLKERLASIPKDDPERLLQFQRYEFQKIEKILDNSNNKANYLEKPEVAKIIYEAFLRMEKEHGWIFPAIVVMPNHVHCLCSGRNATISFDRMVRRLKGSTACKANLVLGRRGNPFWSQESFDHWCRTPEKVESIKKYIINNPVKGGLVKNPEDWPWLKIQ